ncbi:MAG: hypothetical protein CVT95_10730, partial [Bacteroidetes bacterium HGW-Bacteroidetes-12]
MVIGSKGLLKTYFQFPTSNFQLPTLNLSPHIYLIDKSFSKQKAASYKLYLQISKTDIKITILDTDSNTFIGLSVYLLNDV